MKQVMVTVLAVWLAFPASGLAQDATPAPILATPEASPQLAQPSPIDGFAGGFPTAMTFGDGWVVRTGGVAEPAGGVAASRSVAAYASQQGDRVTIEVVPYGSVSEALDVFAATDDRLDGWQGPLTQDDDELGRSELAGLDAPARLRPREPRRGR